MAKGNPPGETPGGHHTNNGLPSRDTHSTELADEAAAIASLANELRFLIKDSDIAGHALGYAANGWNVFPLNGKVPAIRGGHGVLDATTDLTQILAWWQGPYRNCNIGLRPPDNVLVIDIDPRNGGHDTVATLEAAHGPLPATHTVYSGRGDGGKHLYYLKPPGPVTAARLGPGIDVKTSTGYVVAPPSLHPDTGKPYTANNQPIVPAPKWLAALLKPETRTAVTPRFTSTRTYSGPSIAEAFNNTTTWAELLTGWRLVTGDGETDGSRWRHPTATSPSSATVKGGRLYVYTTNTAFAVTEAGHPQGHSKFDAYAVLHHHGDHRAAAKHLKGKHVSAR